MNALERIKLDRLKKQWRKEWEKEEEVITSINTKLQAMHERGLAAMSPRTRAAWEEFKRLEDLDEAEGYCAHKDPDHPRHVDRSRGGRGDDEAEAPTLPPPDWRKGAVKEEEEKRETSGPRLRSLKDDGWYSA